MGIKSNKVKAFTLSEMIVVLMISIIVVGLAFSILRLVQRQMWGMQLSYENSTDLHLLRQGLSIDFATYPYIAHNGSNDRLYFENETHTMEYRFEEEWVIREKDTFNIKISEKTFYYDGLPVVNGSIDAIELTTTKDQGEKTIFIYSSNAADEYMN